jgi:N-acylglucosamine-6-phosphate 2-epimerase
MTPIENIHNGLVVSCQAWPDSPLHAPVFMSVMAQAAAKGGAVGIRANGAEDIEAIRQKVSLPIIGIQKKFDAKGGLWITPTFEEAVTIANAGADIVAIDGIHVERLDGTHLRDLIARIHSELTIYVMVDISTFDEGLRAQRFGADLVATTFAIQDREAPDYDLLGQLTRSLSVPVVAEGLFWTPEQVCRAFELGAHSVVVGTAITRPDEITMRFVQAVKAHFG